jgi:hypothetical protein
VPHVSPDLNRCYYILPWISCSVNKMSIINTYYDQHVHLLVFITELIIIRKYKTTKCTFPKLMFKFFISSTCFEPEGSSSGRRFYIQLWYGKFYMYQCRQFSGFGGLVVSMLASSTQDRGFVLGRSRRIFRAKKSSACLPSEGK